MTILRLSPERYAALQEKARKGAKIEPGRDFPGSSVQAPKKYKNRATGGYASAKEARRAAELKLLVASGAITDYREQVPYVLIPAQRDEAGRLLERECRYVADFVYRERGELVVEDCKGVRTPEYILKRKMMLFFHGTSVKET